MSGRGSSTSTTSLIRAGSTPAGGRLVQPHAIADRQLVALAQRHPHALARLDDPLEPARNMIGENLIDRPVEDDARERTRGQGRGFGDAEPGRLARDCQTVVTWSSGIRQLVPLVAICSLIPAIAFFGNSAHGRSR